MKKRIFIGLLLAAGLTAAAFGQETAETAVSAGKQALKLSFGGGGQLNAAFSTWFADKDAPGDLNRYNSSSLEGTPYVFIDMKYVEINLGLGIGNTGEFDSASPLSANSNFPAKTLSLRGGAYFKLPFTMTKMFTIYPLIGADYELFLQALKDDGRDAKFPISAGNQDAGAMEALSGLSFKAGIGQDTFFTEHLFLRAELLYGLRLPNKLEQYEDEIYTDVKSKLFHGGELKIAIGWRL